MKIDFTKEEIEDLLINLDQCQSEGYLNFGDSAYSAMMKLLFAKDDNKSNLFRPKWISVKDKAAPKKDKFLFSYHYGVGLGNWSQAYTTFNGNSERTHEIYFLILWPMDISENNGEPMQWTEEKMIEMDVMWMPLPKPPGKDGE